MSNYHQMQVIFRRAGLAVAAAMLMIVASLVLLQLNVLAGARGKGPGCGGDLLDGNEQNGDLILLLYSPSGWETASPLATRNLQIEGGWQLKSGETCDPSAVYTDTSKFEFIGPLTRSLATEIDSGSVLRIDPSVLTLTVKHIIFEQDGSVTQGGGISGIISNGAHILLENVAFANGGGGTADDGGGLFLEVRGNSRLVIADSQFMTNTAQNSGGGFELEVYDGSQVTINNTQVFGNIAFNGNGGGGRILMSRGMVTIAGSTFSNNLANQGCGGGLSVEGIGSGPNYLILQNTVISNNDAIPCADDNLHVTGNVIVLDKQIFLPIIRKNS